MASSNPRLSKLLEGVKRGTLSARAKSTASAYDRWAEKFRLFCEENALGFLPSDPTTAAMYIESLRQSELSISSLGQAQAAISWIHKAAGEADPTDSAMVKNLISSAKRNAPPVKHTTPAEKAHLERIAEGLEENPTRTNRRTATLAVLIFAGCCRLDDVIGLERWNFTFLDDGLKLFLPKIKNDQLRVGNTKWIPLANDERLCATSLLQTWFKSAEIDKDEKAPVFPMFTNHRKAISTTSFSEG
ncbi:MAG: hypothetical protein GY696_06125, partial [Gammaproteobacteria bacterium]|nr:hypothetical protein [Gammaproteobacteria bacterium]